MPASQSAGAGALPQPALEALRERLANAFRSCGCDEPWMPDDLLDALDQCLRERGLADCGEATVVTLLTGSLQAAGFADVARTFANPALEVPADQIGNGDAGEVTPAGPGIRTRYIAADQWNLECDLRQQELLRLRILRLCPASDVLPVAVIECDLNRLYDLPTPPRQEQELLAVLRGLCGAIRNLLAQMGDRMSQRWIEHRSGHSRVLFNHYDSFLKTASRSRLRRKQTELRERLAALWTAELALPGMVISYG